MLLFTEHSPKSTGIQPIEDILPLVEHNPVRFRPVANINPHLHYPVAAELARQAGLGAVACKIHPVHGGFDPADRMLYPAYAWARSTGSRSSCTAAPRRSPGRRTRTGSPALLDPVMRDFPGLSLVLAHGGRGWWYEQAAFLALMRPNVWLEVSGLPPHRLPDYYGPTLPRLSAKMIFGTDWPGVPGVQRNARGLQKVLLEAGCADDHIAAALGGNAARVFGLARPQLSRAVAADLARATLSAPSKRLVYSVPETPVALVLRQNTRL